jgi:hypothetical protein
MSNLYKEFSTKNKNSTHKQWLHRKTDLWARRVCSGHTLFVLCPPETTTNIERTLGSTLHTLHLTPIPESNLFFLLVFLTGFAYDNRWGIAVLMNFFHMSTTLTWPDAIKASSTPSYNAFTYTFLALLYALI